MSEISRNPEESFIDYANRLINGRDSKLYDINSAELWELLFGDKLSKDEARKRVYGLQAALSKMIEEALASMEEITTTTEIAEPVIEIGSDILARIQEERRELEKAKIQYRDQKRENAKLLYAESRLDSIKDFIQEVASEIAVTKPLLVGNPVKQLDNETEGVLLLSDWHYGMDISNRWNTYNKAEFNKRIELLINNTIEYGINHNIQTLHVCDLGDLCAGIIHPNVRVTSSEDVVSQTMYVAEILAEVLTSLATQFYKVNFYSVLDNHSRVTPNLNDSLAVESFARFIHWYLQTRLESIENIEICDTNIDEDIAKFTVCRSTCLAVHGHRDNIATIIKTLPAFTKTFADYIFMGHMHSPASKEDYGCQVVMNGSLMGTDDYAKHLRLSTFPSQTLLIFNNKGKLCQYEIRLKENYLNV